MSIEKIEVGIDLAAKLTGINAEDLQARLGETDGEEESNPAETFAALVNERRKSQIEQIKHDKFNQGIKEKGKAIESALNPILQRFNIEADRAEEAIELLAEKLQDKPGTPDLSNLTADQIEQLPAYQQALKTRDNLKAKLEEVSRQFNDYKQQVQTKEIRSTLGRHVRRIFQEKKANIGSSTLDDAAEFFLNGLNLSQFKTEGDQVVILSGDGTPLTDDFGEPTARHFFLTPNK